MGVYVFDMKMPHGCNECRFSVNGFCRASPKLAVGAAMSKRERTNYCPLVYVPPHGRCIDADAFAAEMKKRQEAAGKWLREAKDRETAVRADAVLSFLCEVKLTLDAAPTIIPAESSEEQREYEAAVEAAQYCEMYEPTYDPETGAM